jgi:hypothetical protein
MIYAAPGQTFTAISERATTGLTGTIGVRIERTDGTNHTPRTTAGIVEVEPNSGVYAKSNLVAPSTAGTYLVMWDTGGGSPQFATEELTVTSSTVAPGAEPGPTYATPDDLRAYANVSEDTLPDPEALRVLALAERDVDRTAGNWGVLATGRKFEPVSMVPIMAAALNRATCAQAEYRLAKGEEFFIESQVPIDEEQREPRIGPKCKEELIHGGLRRATAPVL